ncbi:MAG: hypothetical protein JSV80_04650 [Acidobacteriota bacterium]|nr:MAG: hypothetical protein JSV80_04650 [Acidobacteriota bacterium]
MKTLPSVHKIEVPARCETLKVRRLAGPPETRTVHVPADYETVTRTVKVSDGKMACAPVLCQTNATASMITRIQSALKSAGYDPGPVDGVIGRQTMGPRVLIRNRRDSRRVT